MMTIELPFHIQEQLCIHTYKKQKFFFLQSNKFYSSKNFWSWIIFWKSDAYIQINIWNFLK